MQSTRTVLGRGHPLIRSLIRLLRTARFARGTAALISSLARSLTHSRAHGKEVFVYEMNASISYSYNLLSGLSDHASE